MRKLLIVMAVLFAVQLSSQEKLGRPFFTSTFNFTLGINENYTLDPDDGESHLRQSLVFHSDGDRSRQYANESAISSSFSSS